MHWTIAKKLSIGFSVIICLRAVGSCFTFWQMAQIIHAQKVNRVPHSRDESLLYEILSAVGQLNGALLGYIIARLNNDPDETTRLHTMVDHLWTDIDTATGTLQGLDSGLRSPEERTRLPQFISDLRETRSEQYNYLQLEEGADEGAHQASLSINVSSVLWAEKVRTGARSLVDVVSAASNRESRRATGVATFALIMAIFIVLSVGGIATAAAVLASRRLATAVPVLISHARQISPGDLATGEIVPVVSSHQCLSFA